MSTGLPGERLLAYLVGAFGLFVVRESVRVGTRQERSRREPFRWEIPLYSLCVLRVRKLEVPLDFKWSSRAEEVVDKRRGKSYAKGGTTAKGTDEGIHAMSGRGCIICLRMMRLDVRGVKRAWVEHMKLESVTRR